MIALLGAALPATAQELRDPMRPPVTATRTAAPREPAPVLSAVLNFKGERTAIFNGHLVHGGTALGAYTIEAVLVDGVRYRHAGLTQELHMAPPVSTIKRPAADPARAPSGVH